MLRVEAAVALAAVSVNGVYGEVPVLEGVAHLALHEGRVVLLSSRE